VDSTIEHPEGGPGGLAEALMEKRRALEGQTLASWIFADLEESELVDLLRVAFELSFRKDEGRYPSVTIVVPSREEKHLIESADVRFRPEIPIDARVLRRLSFAVPDRPHALLVRVSPEGLVATGIGRFETAGALLPEDQTGLYLRAGGLVVEVDGPGDLSVHEAGEVFTLRAGRIERQLDGNRALERLPGFHALERETAAEALGPVANDRLRTKMIDAVRDAWMYVLKRAVAMSHGGAFAVLPSDARSVDELPEDWTGRLQVTYPTGEPDLLRSVLEYVEARWGAAGGERHTALQAFLDAANAVSALSGTDGFVVMNRGLRVLGFGAKVSWEEAFQEACPEVDEKLQVSEASFELHRAGMRHTAGFMLCQSLPGAFAFVISQDGELRVFFSEEGVTRVTAPLAPITYLFQGI
jgi:hypothetical protein